jgi:hypothetical protein
VQGEYKTFSQTLPQRGGTIGTVWEAQTPNAGALHLITRVLYFCLFSLFAVVLKFIADLFGPKTPKPETVEKSI